MKKQIAALEAQVKDLQAFAGVLMPLFEKQYKKDGWKWEGKKASKKAR